MRNYYIYRKLDHFIRNYYNTDEGNMNTAKTACNNFDGDDYAFITIERALMPTMSE